MRTLTSISARLAFQDNDRCACSSEKPESVPHQHAVDGFGEKGAATVIAQESARQECRLGRSNRHGVSRVCGAPAIGQTAGAQYQPKHEALVAPRHQWNGFRMILGLAAITFAGISE